MQLCVYVKLQLYIKIILKNKTDYTFDKYFPVHFNLF